MKLMPETLDEALMFESSGDAFGQYAEIQQKLEEVISALENADHYQWSLAHIGDVERSAQMIVEAARSLRRRTGRVDI